MTLRLDPVKDSELIARLSRNGALKDEPKVTHRRKPKRTLPDPQMTGKQVSEIFLVLPMPPSENRRHGKRRDGTIGTTKEWGQYKKTARCAALLKKTGWIAGKIEVTAKFYFPTEASDLDNRLKALFDALQNVCYRNDRQIKRYREIEALIDRLNPRVEIFLKEFTEVPESDTVDSA